MNIETRLERIEMLATLPDDWDNYGGKAVTRQAVDEARVLVTAIHGAGVSMPRLYPTPLGGLVLSWREGEQVEIEIDEKGKARVSYDGMVE